MYPAKQPWPDDPTDGKASGIWSVSWRQSLTGIADHQNEKKQPTRHVRSDFFVVIYVSFVVDFSFPRNGGHYRSATERTAGPSF